MDFFPPKTQLNNVLNTPVTIKEISFINFITSKKSLGQDGFIREI